MKKNSILGKDGLTITSANHLANISKEMYEAIESRIESLKLYSKDFELALNGNTYRVENESGKEDLEAISEEMKRIGALKSLIAYLREGIKAKEALDNDDEFEEHVKELVKEGRTDLERPNSFRADVKFDDEFIKLTPAQRARYYSLEARCATIGGFIHPDGALAKARKEYFEHTGNPIKVNGRGQEAEICTFSSNFTPEDVDGEFFALQKEYRSLQAEFNSMKAEIDRRVNDINRKAAADALAAVERWNAAERVERQKYDEAVKALKIVIPQNLKEIYEEVSRVATAR